MRRSTRLAEKQAKVKKEAEREPRTKKKRSNVKITTIATIDNGTMVEAFKHLKYCQLAKGSLVSKRFRDLIQTHRHKLALLYVDRIGMSSIRNDTPTIKIFDNELSSEVYNEWVIRNNYSKEVSLEDQVATTQRTQNDPNGYQLSAYAHYKDPNHRHSDDRTTVFFAYVEFNHENWPLFQHFVRLATDPFIFIECMKLTYQNDVLNLLAGAINSDHDRLQCKKLMFDWKYNSQDSFAWIKKHVRYNESCIFSVDM